MARRLPARLRQRGRALWGAGQFGGYYGLDHVAGAGIVEIGFQLPNSSQSRGCASASTSPPATAAFPSGGRNHVGVEYDVVATFTPHRTTTIEVGFFHFDGGAMFSAARSRDVQFVYTSIELRYRVCLIPAVDCGYGRPMRGSPLRTLLVALVAAIAAILWFRSQAGAPLRPAPGATGTAGGTPAAPVAPDARQAPDTSEASPGAPPVSDPGELASAWEEVDMDEIRRVMPENTFWTMSAPTQDERVIQEREEERARWNVEYGKVLSGNASEEEIRAYYAHRQRLSADYVEFTSYVLDHHGDDLSEQDVGLLELARRLHLARLEEYPRQTQRAFERKVKQDEARAAWLADEAEFGAMAPPE